MFLVNWFLLKFELSIKKCIMLTFFLTFKMNVCFLLSHSLCLLDCPNIFAILLVLRQLALCFCLLLILFNPLF